MPENYKEVRFDKWCCKCKHKSEPESLDPCCECLDTEFREDSTKPVRFEPKEV